MDHAIEYAGLFAIAFLAATVLPAQSEFALVAMLASGRYETWLLIVVASLGNVLGSVANWVLGRFLVAFKDKSWFPIRAADLARAEGWYHRYGRWSLLLSWAPFVGDPLTIAAGVLREPLWVFVLLVGVAKVGRYLVVAALVPA